jgi:glycosyltransferase involved in cell wall biosynthesis
MQADVVHLHDPWMAGGFRLARGGRLRWGVSEHGFGAYTDAVAEEGVPYRPALLRWHRRQEARVLAAAGFVICPTQSARAQLARDLVLPAPGAHWHAVPHARPAQQLPARAAARQALGWAAESTQLLAIGRINPVKRFDALVRACVQLNRPLHLTLLGEGDAAPLQALATQGAQLRLTVAAVDDVAPYLAAADLYISSSRNESFGIANLEALAAGLPALCTAVGSVPEVVGAGAALVSGADGDPPADLPAALAQAIADLLDDPGRRQQLAAAGRQRAQAWPDADAVAARLEAIYRAPGESQHVAA